MRLFFKFLKPYRGRCAAALLMAVLDVAGALLIPTITAQMINISLSGGNIWEILSRGVLMLAVSLAVGAGTLYGSWLQSDISSKLGRDLRNAVYDKSLTLSSSDFERFGTGSMITRTLSDINAIQQAFVMFIQFIFPVPVMCAMGMAFAFGISGRMGMLLLGIMVFVMAAAAVIVRRASAIFEKLQRFMDRMNTVLRENITGVRVIRAFNKETHEEARMGRAFSDYAGAAISANRLFAALDSLAMTTINLCIVAILYLGGVEAGRGAMQIGDITAVIEYAVLILFYIIIAQMVVIMLPRAIICFRRVREVIEQEPEITDGQGTLAAGEDREIVRLENVGFRFEDADEDTLKGLSFCCRRGETTAIIGGTGSGKSTVVKLILRYHDVTEGRILLKGTDIWTIRQKELREHISYVPQKAWLFSGTVEENLRYGNDEAGREELERVLSIAQADFVKELPGGLKARTAQGGTNFSGGQKQRLSIARALAKKAELYIFDDSFSALDFKTDAALRKALASEMKDAAFLIVAQRISTIVNADQIIVLGDGKVEGIGSHAYLMENCPAYREIAESQMKGGREDGE